MKNKEHCNTYLGLCSQVYDLDKPRPPENTYSFYRDYAINAKGKILEPMCGTGRYLLPLLLEGFNIEGYDLSPQMLSLLKNKAKEMGLDPAVWKGQIDEFKSTKHYDLIFIPDGSFCLLTDTDTITKALEGIYKTLKEGGVFVFDIETINSISSQGTTKSSIYRLNNGKMIIYSEFTILNNDICSFICRYELVSTNEIIKTEIEEIKIRIFENSELTNLLYKTGFKKVNRIKAFNRYLQPDDDDKCIVFECIK